MNKVDKEFNKIVMETVGNLLHTSTERYMEIKLILLSYQTDDEMIQKYLQKLFAFTDRHRPLMIEKKEGIVV